ncbi:MAG: hypothetical protein M3015_13125 [Bacteroidota bacterium]|nr:hypothetical protein [Bacteroidota bacterium]
MAVIEEDIIRTIYEELFTVKFLHSGYGFPHPGLIANSITIEPNEATKKLFVNYNLGYRFFNDTLMCFIRASLVSPPDPEPKVPFLKFAGEVKFRFLINASTDFLNKTDVAAAGSKQVYQFTNQVNAGTGGFISMHATGVDLIDDLKNVGVVKAEKICFGVIDIFNTDAINSSYDLFDNNTDQKLKSPAYKILFKSKI